MKPNTQPRLTWLQYFKVELQSAVNKQKEEGFTLIELLLVIGIIAILAAIVILAINPTANIQSAQTRTGQKQAREIQNAIVQYIIDQGAPPNGIGGTPQVLCSDGFTPDDGDCEISLESSLASKVDSDYSFIAKIPQHPAFTPPNSGHEVSYDGSRFSVSPLPISNQSVYKVYYIDDTDGQLKRVNLDGSGVEVVVNITTPWFGFDKDNNLLYVHNPGTKEVFTTAYDGTNQSATLVTLPDLSPMDIIPVPSIAKIFYRAQNIHNYNINSFDPDGSNNALVFVSDSGHNIDEVNGRIFYTENYGYYGDDRSIFSANIDGTVAREIYKVSKPACVGLCVGGADFNYELSSIYYSKNEDKLYVYQNENGTDTIVSMNADGTNVQTLHTATGRVGAFVVHAATGKLYWTDFLANTGNIYRSDLDGSNVETIFTGDYPSGMVIDPQNNKIIFQTGSQNDDDAALNRMDLDGSNQEVIVTDGYRFQLLLDGSL